MPIPWEWWWLAIGHEDLCKPQRLQKKIKGKQESGRRKYRKYGRDIPYYSRRKNQMRDKSQGRGQGK